jgi:hypothetical protein
MSATVIPFAPRALVTVHRQTLRDLTVATLLGATDAADRVYPTPILPWRRDRPLPAIGVYTLHERGEPFGQGNMTAIQLRQSCDITIEALVEVLTDETLDADARLRLDTAVPLDQLCAQIQLVLSQAFMTDPAWLDATEGMERFDTLCTLGRTDETDRRTAGATLTWTVNYTCIQEPVFADDFLSAGINVDVIDPAADPNTTGHPTGPPPDYPGGYPGPDGRIEVRVEVPGPNDAPLWPPPRGANGSAKEGS